MSGALKILIVRRDNIGDLVCTTPVFTALREHFPDALICALVNSYNAPALALNPSLDRVFVYTKLKHREPGQSRLRLLWERLRMFRELKKIAFDYVLLPSDHPRLLRFASGLRPRHIVALGNTDAMHGKITLLPAIRAGDEHEAQATYRLLEPLGIHGTPPRGSIVAHPVEANKVKSALDAKGGSGTVIAIHISARKPSQRWPIERFVELMRALHARHGLRFILLWAPGSETNPLHPGDDEKARAILRAAGDLPILPYATHTLPELIGALSACDSVICSDGGAMHLAAGLGKPIVCLFGDSDAWRWHPWSVPYELLQPVSRDVRGIDVEAVLEAYERLRGRVNAD
jgi:ADP-heptose:LPS heptosyltransferase